MNDDELIRGLYTYDEPPTPVPEPGRERREPAPLLVVHGMTWRVRAGERYLVVQRELAGVELTRLHGIPTTVTKDDGPGRALRPAELYERYGVTAERVRWTYGAAGASWNPAERILDLPGARVCPGTMAYDEQVQTWLEMLGGEPLLDWLGTIGLLDRPTAALQLRGPPSVGKSLLAAGLATYLGGRCDYREASGDWDACLIYGPLVVLDEGIAESRPDAFRRLTGNREHRVTEKHRSTEDLRGCPRVLVTSNEHDPLRLGRELLSAESEDAIGRRLLVIEAPESAAAYLEELGGWGATSSWVGPEGAFVRHLRWLSTRDVKHGSRFLVEGDSEEWVATAHQRAGIAADVVAAYQVWAEGDPALRSRCDGIPFLEMEGHVGISAGALQRSWRTLLGPQERVPSNQPLGVALKRLSKQEKPTRRGPREDRGERRYWVPVGLLPKIDDGSSS